MYMYHEVKFLSDVFSEFLIPLLLFTDAGRGWLLWKEQRCIQRTHSPILVIQMFLDWIAEKISFIFWITTVLAEQNKSTHELFDLLNLHTHLRCCHSHWPANFITVILQCRVLRLWTIRIVVQANFIFIGWEKWSWMTTILSCIIFFFLAPCHN